jgi:hypothetical protein
MNIECLKFCVHHCALPYDCRCLFAFHSSQGHFYGLIFVDPGACSCSIASIALTSSGVIARAGSDFRTSYAGATSTQTIERFKWLLVTRPLGLGLYPESYHPDGADGGMESSPFTRPAIVQMAVVKPGSSGFERIGDDPRVRSCSSCAGVSTPSATTLSLKRE